MTVDPLVTRVEHEQLRADSQELSRRVQEVIQEFIMKHDAKFMVHFAMAGIVSSFGPACAVFQTATGAPQDRVFKTLAEYVVSMMSGVEQGESDAILRSLNPKTNLVSLDENGYEKKTN